MSKGINIAEKNGMWKGGINADYYERVAFENYPKECSLCGSTKNIQVHHKNRNRRDNRLENLMIVCRDCHWKIHKHFVSWSRKENKCKNCGSDKVKHNAKGLCRNCYNQEFMKDKRKDYYKKNKEKISKNGKEWYNRNKEEKLEKQKIRRKEDGKYVEYHNKKSLEWYHKQKELARKATK